MFETNYGLIDQDKGYNYFNNLGDLNGKIVVVLSCFPGHNYPDSKTFNKFKPEDVRAVRRQMSRYFGRSPRFPWAAKKGVLAFIEYNPGRNPIAQWADNLPAPTELTGPARGIRKRMHRMGETNRRNR